MGVCGRSVNDLIPDVKCVLGVTGLLPLGGPAEGLLLLHELAVRRLGRRRRDPAPPPRNSESTCQLIQTTQAGVLIWGYGGRRIS